MTTISLILEGKKIKNFKKLFFKRHNLFKLKEHMAPKMQNCESSFAHPRIFMVCLSKNKQKKKNTTS